MHSNNILQFANDYYKVGLLPLPLCEPCKSKAQSGKKPILKEWTKLSFDNYSLEDVNILFNSHKGNIGIITGINNLVVLDFDDYDKYLSFYDEFPWVVENTVISKTNRGVHIYLSVENGGFSGDGYFNGVKFGQVQGKGKQVVAPPSNHMEGTVYSWVRSPFENSIVCIKSLDELNIQKKDLLNAKSVNSQKAEQILQIGCDAIRLAPDGSQNNTISKFAGKIFLEVEKGKIDRDYAYEQLLNASIEGNHPESRAIATIDSAMDYAKSAHLNNKQGGLLKNYNNTDMGNALRMRDLYGNICIYIPEKDRFAIWNGIFWDIDETGAVIYHMYREMLALMRNELNALSFEYERRDIMIKWCTACEWVSTFSSTLKHFRLLRSVSFSYMDNDDNLINCQNGVLNLDTIELVPHSSDYYMMKCVQANYNPEAQAPRWIKFIQEITLNRPELMEYIQRIAGYILSGKTSEKCMFFFYGNQGDNGKSTLINIIIYILNDYAMKIMAESIMARNGLPRSVNNDLARLKGSRLVVSSEVSEGQKFNDGLIRDLCGDGDPITTRFLFREFFTYIPKFKIIAYGNNKPYISVSDNAIKKKIKMIPFDFEAINPDKNLMTYFKDAEIDGIFNWMVQGWIKYRESGLGNVPECVMGETEEYFSDNDFFNSFIDEECIIGNELSISKNDLYHAYAVWSRHDNEYQMNKRKLGVVMKKRGFKDGHSSNGSTRIWKGLKTKIQY